MHTSHLTRITLASLAAGLAWTALPLTALAQQSSMPQPPAPPSVSPALAAPAAPEPPQSPQPSTAAADTITPPGSTAPRNWTTDQILTATVHQAWILAGKDENNFFEIVRELAAISAQNRNLTLPDTPEAGRKAGAFIKAQAKEDHDQLLYDIVDKSVRMTGTKAPAESAGTGSPATSPQR